MPKSLDLSRTILPENIKLKLQSLDSLNLAISGSETDLDVDNYLDINLEKVFNIHSKVSYMNAAIAKIITEIFGSNEIRISAPKYILSQNLQEPEFRITGLLNKQKIELIFGQPTTLKYKLIKNFAFNFLPSELPIFHDLKLKNSELILTDTGYCYTHPKLGCINLSRGFNFIGDIDFKNFPANFSSFIQQNLKMTRFAAMISFNPAGQVSLTSNIAGDIQLFCQQQFKATFNNLLINLNIGSNLEPNFGLTGNLILEGYDTSQEQEPQLLLSGNLSLEPESLTAFFSQQSEKPWCNPYGLVGTELRNIRFQGGGTYLPPYFDNFGFIGDLKWEKADLEVAFLMDTNDPERLALILNPRQPVSLIDLWRGPVTSFINKQVGYSINLVNQALGFLEKFLTLNIELIDGDGQLNPLIKYVPFPTTIAGQAISEGLEINGKVHAWGHEAILSLQGDKTFQNIVGFLKVPEIDLGFLKIKGTDDDSLDIALKVTPNDQYLQGDGYLEIFDQEIANVEFIITSNNATFKNFDISLANLLSIDVDALSIDLKSGSGSGAGTISLLGNTLVGITFDVSKNHINLNNVYLGLANFLNLTIPSLTIDLINKSATGTANIVAFNQSLGGGTLSLNTQNVAINNAVINLGNVLNLSVPNFQLDLMNRKLFGLGDVTLLGKKFTASGISLSESGLQASSNFDFGILAFNGATVTLLKKTDGNIDNSASLAGNLKFLGYTFADITASINSTQLIISGSFNFAGILILKGVNNQKNARIILNKAKQGMSTFVSIIGSFYLLSQELTSLTISHNHETLKILGIKVISKPRYTT
ncbi:hypothetical protein IQ244_07300 [Nostoc sp. LEGE 06077]|uniref:hypothetical protein n=1 Tax=Nostoc sp. LEGE 06077 TaxID=915325 RepID=UPI00187EBA33|nr:hypothetical protein [Nostoc sp. LEGE 06077]MBE9206320.1 hypothetical protein [Nostoc sp. LEGE 06077]